MNHFGRGADSQTEGLYDWTPPGDGVECEFIAPSTEVTIQ